MEPIDVYCRVSRKGDKDQRSTGGQEQVCRDVLADRGLPVGMVHVDDGKSAWNPRTRRDGWEALMARLESGAAAGVIVFDLERFARRMADGQRLVDAARHGLMVLDSDAEYDLTSASGEKAFNDAMSAAVYYSHRLSDRVKRGKRRKAMEGDVDRHQLFGFGEDGMTVHEPEAQLIRWAAEHLLHGDSQGALVESLNTRGVKTRQDNDWNQNRLREVLLRPRNAGRIVHSGVLVGQLPEDNRILDPDTYDRVVSLYAARRRGRPASGRYVCSGMAFCGLCGKKLAGRPRTNRWYPDCEPTREYWCSPSSYQGCARTLVDQRELDAAARELTIAYLSDPGHASRIEAAATDRAEALRDLDEKIAKDEALALALSDRLGRGEMDLDRYDTATRPLDKRLVELRERRESLAGPEVSSATTVKPGVDWARRWDGGTPEERRELLKMALHGRVLIVGPADPDDPRNVALRLEITKLER